MEVGISVIIPLYNCADCVHLMINSLKQQTYREFEVVFVDDGSRDNSAQVAEELMKDSGLPYTVLRQENAGPGAARNRGIEHAAGEYLLFADSDDQLEKDSLQVLYQTARDDQSDIVLFGYFQDFYNEDGTLDHTVTVTPVPGVYPTHQQAVEVVSSLDEQKVFSFAWNKLCRTSLIKQSGVRFSDRRHSEDYFFYVELFRHVKSLSVVGKSFYHYAKTHRETLTGLPFHQGVYELVGERYRAMKELLESAGVYGEEQRRLCANTHIKHLMWATSNDFAKEGNIPKKERYRHIKAALQDPDTKEALRYAGGGSRAVRIVNTVMKTKWTPLIYLLSSMTHSLRQGKGRLFDAVKSK